MSKTQLDLAHDHRTYEFDSYISKQIYNYLKNKNCVHCNTPLNPEVARYYQANKSGWTVNVIKQKVWIWFECPKAGCHYGNSLNRLGVPTSQIIEIK